MADSLNLCSGCEGRQVLAADNDFDTLSFEALRQYGLDRPVSLKSNPRTLALTAIYTFETITDSKYGIAVAAMTCAQRQLDGECEVTDGQA